MRAYRFNHLTTLLVTLVFILCLFTTRSWSASEPAPYEAQLWLPKAFESSFKELKSAAVVVNKTEKCHQLLSGKLLESRSEPDGLIFTFRCRTKERYSFSVEFNNNTQQIADPYEPFRLREEQAKLLKKEQTRLLNKQKEQQLLQNELDREKQLKAACFSAMKQRIDEFRQPQIIEEILFVNTSDEGEATYGLAFDSISSKNKSLYYKVECKVVKGEDHQMRVSPRAEAWLRKSN